MQDETAKKGMFGFPIDNTIGGTSQPNGWMDNWVDFYRERRLQHQLKLTKDPKLQQMGKKLCDNLEHFFEGVNVSFLRSLQQHSAQPGSFVHSQHHMHMLQESLHKHYQACLPASHVHCACQERHPCSALFGYVGLHFCLLS